MAIKMIDVGAKTITHRIAVATGLITVGKAAFEHVKNNTLPKGNALTLCEITGIQGAKKAYDLMALCHPMGLDHVQIIPELVEDGHAIRVSCVAATHAKTGVEMEALAGVNAALLNLWDVIKMIEPALLISDVRLLAKRGGKSGIWLNEDVPEWVKALIDPPLKPVLSTRKCVVLTLSDRAHDGVYDDKSGILLKDTLVSQGAEIVAYEVLPDEAERLTDAVRHAIDEHDPHLIICTGGTGVAARDVTPEALLPLFEKTVPGIGELLRKDGAQFTPLSWSSRSVGGIIGQTLIITLPGSPKAVKEAMGALLPDLLPHLIGILRGDKK